MRRIFYKDLYKYKYIYIIKKIIKYKLILKTKIINYYLIKLKRIL